MRSSWTSLAVGLSIGLMEQHRRTTVRTPGGRVLVHRKMHFSTTDIACGVRLRSLLANVFMVLG